VGLQNVESIAPFLRFRAETLVGTFEQEPLVSAYMRKSSNPLTDFFNIKRVIVRNVNCCDFSALVVVLHFLKTD
jgi:hypothetical protein